MFEKYKLVFNLHRNKLIKIDILNRNNLFNEFKMLSYICLGE